MQDPFTQVADDSVVGNDDALMTRATDSPMPGQSTASGQPTMRGGGTRSEYKPVASAEFADAAQGKRVCPFCGSINERPESNGDPAPCPKCMMQDTAATRHATKVRIGPWYVRQSRNPAAPGMRFETLLTLVKRGQVGPGSVVRGPTTHQLWTFAANVKGLSRAFGLCHGCGESIETTATICPACSRMQEPPVNPDTLMETAPAPTPGTPAAATPTPPPAVKSPAVKSPASAPQAAPPPAPLSKQPPREPSDRSRNNSLRRGEEILTARELAAAFQLDFVPANERSRAGSWRPSQNAGRKIALLLLFMLTLGGAIALILRPEWRDQVTTWSSSAVASVREVVVRASTDEEPTAATASTETTAANELDDAYPQASVSSGRLQVTDPPDQQPLVAPPASTEASRVQTAPVDRVPNTFPPSSAQSPRPTDASVATIPATDSATSTATPQLSAVQLYRQAIAAEGKRPPDHAEAIRLYEQIKKLPREAWPGDLQIRLDRARRAQE